MRARNQSASVDYMTRTFVREPEYFKTIRTEGERRRAGMQVSPYEGYMLNWLVRMFAARYILEIGTFMGYSTLWMAEALSKGGHITTLEKSEEHAQNAVQHFACSPHVSRITLHAGDAHAWLATQPATAIYDLVFIDAEKKGYADYLDAVLPRMNPRGVIIGDNTLLFGAMAGEAEPSSAAAYESMQRFNDTLADSTRFESILLPTIEGLTVARLK